MLFQFLTWLNLIDIFANVFDWVEIRSLCFELELLEDSIRRVEVRTKQVSQMVSYLENNNVNMFGFTVEKDRNRLENIFNI